MNAAPKVFVCLPGCVSAVCERYGHAVVQLISRGPLTVPTNLRGAGDVLKLPAINVFVCLTCHSKVYSAGLPRGGFN